MKNKNVKWILGGLSIIILVLMLLYMQGIIGGGKIETEKPVVIELPQNLETMLINSTTIGENIKHVGNICSKTKSTISSKIVARIEKIYVKSGDLVKKGAKLIKLEDKDIKAKLNQAKAALDAAYSRLNQAKADFERYDKLFADRTITRQEFERAETALKGAKAQMEQAENAKEEAEAFLDYSQINAPFDSLVVEKKAEEGDMASPGKSLLFIYDPNDIWFESQVPESRSNLVAIGLEVYVFVDAFKEKYKGKIVEVVPAVDQASRTMTVRIEIPKDERLKCGMYGSFEISAGELKTVLIPQKAVKKIGQLDSVYVLFNGKLNMRNIVIGKEYDNKIEILSGLSDGEEIVLNPEIIKELKE